MNIFSISVVLLACIVGLHCESTAGDTDGPADTSPTKPGPSTESTAAAPTTTEKTTAPAQTTITEKPFTEGPTMPPKGSWYVEANKTLACLRMDMELIFFIQYETKKNETVTLNFTLPGTDKSDPTETGGECASSSSNDKVKKENIIIDFEGYKDWSVEFKYETDGKEYHCSEIVFEFTMTKEHFPDIKDEEENGIKSIHNKTLWSVDVGNSWQCNSNESVSDFMDKRDAVVRMDTKDLQVQAFADKDENIKSKFSDAIPCPADSKVSNIVPIAVGAALAALVVIVLIAYLIGRRRNKRGYESV